MIGTEACMGSMKESLVAVFALSALPVPGPPRDIGVVGHGVRLVAEPGQFYGIDFDVERQTPGLLHDLETPLLRGTIALLVKTRTVSEFKTAARVLLRYSTHQVRTREVADLSSGR